MPDRLLVSPCDCDQFAGETCPTCTDPHGDALAVVVDVIADA